MKLLKKINTSIAEAISKKFTIEPPSDEMLDRVGRSMMDKGQI